MATFAETAVKTAVEQAADRSLRSKTTRGSASRVVQPHGGALLSGGKPGNTGGSGRPRSALRARLRGSFEERVAVLEGIADDPTAHANDRIRAVDVIARYGLGSADEGLVSADEVREHLRETIAVLRAALSPEQFSAILTELEAVWSG